MIGALFVLAAAVGGTTQVPPIDECASDNSFMQFRSDLRRTVAQRDAKALLSVVADDVHASLGGHVGKKDFVELWGLEKPHGSRVWAELGQALSLGCSLKSGVATAPSFEDQLGDRDPYETLIALPGAVLRRGPSDDSPAMTQLRWHVLTIRSTPSKDWVAVRLDDGRRGFVRRSLVRSPIDYRAWFEKRDGRWIMAGFLAGD